MVELPRASNSTRIIGKPLVTSRVIYTPFATFYASKVSTSVNLLTRSYPFLIISLIMSTTPTEENLLDSSKGTDDGSLSSYEAAAQSDNSVPVYQDPVERERQMLEWKEELLKVEGEIATLRQVLGTKVRHSSELKRKLGITPFQEFKEDLNTGLQHIRSSDSYQKTNEKLHQINDKILQSSAYQKTAAVAKTAGEKTSAAFNNIGSSMSRKIGDLRNSSTFKSLEEGVSHTYASVKARVSGSRSSTSIDENLKTEAEGEGTDQSPTTPADLPEEKVPL